MTSILRFTDHQRNVLENFEIVGPSSPSRYMSPERLSSQVIFLVAHVADNVIREQQAQFIKAFADSSTCLIHPLLHSAEHLSVRSFEMFRDLPEDLTVRGLGRVERIITDDQSIELADLDHKRLNRSRTFMHRYEIFTESCARVFSSLLNSKTIVIEDDKIRGTPEAIEELEEAHDFSRDPELTRAKDKLLRADEKYQRFLTENDIEICQLGVALLDQQEGKLSKLESILPEVVQQYDRVIVLCPEEYVIGNMELFHTLEKLRISSVILAPEWQIEETWKRESRSGIKRMEMVEFQVLSENGSMECPPLNNCRFSIPKQFLSHYPPEFTDIEVGQVTMTVTTTLTRSHIRYYGEEFEAKESLKIEGLDSRTAAQLVKMQLAVANTKYREQKGLIKIVQTAFNHDNLFHGINLERIETSGTISVQLDITQHSWYLKFTSSEKFTLKVTKDNLEVDAAYLFFRMKMDHLDKFVLTKGRTIHFTDIPADIGDQVSSKLDEAAGDKSLSIIGTITTSIGLYYSITAVTDVEFILKDIDESSKKRKDVPSDVDSDAENASASTDSHNNKRAK